jgi:hypothetical protein
VRDASASGTRQPQGERINARGEDQDGDEVAGPAAGGNRFGLLLLVLVTTYLVSAFAGGQWIVAVQVILLALVTVLAARTAAVPARDAKLIAVGVLAGSAVMVALALANEAGRGVADAWIAMILLFTVVVIVHRILITSTVTMNSIYGAISAYLVLGIMFAAIYAAIDHLGGGHFFVNGEPVNNKTLQYFSFTTLTTLGYGDFTAAGAPGRAIAVLEALTGQIFLATLIARLVSAFRGSAERQQ